MNVVLFVVPENLEAVTEIAKTVRKHKKIDWVRYVVVYDRAVEAQSKDMAGYLAEAGGELKLHPMIVGLKPVEAKMITEFASYISRIYTLYPGESLLMDGTGIPSKEGWLEQMRSAHRTHGKAFTGRFRYDRGGAIPMGPVIFDAPMKQLKIFRFTIDPDWRSRGRYLFDRNHHNLHHKQFPFEMRDIPGLSRHHDKNPAPVLNP